MRTAAVDHLPLLVGLSPVVILVGVWVAAPTLRAQALEDASITSPVQPPPTHTVKGRPVDHTGPSLADTRLMDIHQPDAIHDDWDVSHVDSFRWQSHGQRSELPCPWWPVMHQPHRRVPLLTSDPNPSAVLACASPSSTTIARGGWTPSGSCEPCPTRTCRTCAVRRRSRL